MNLPELVKSISRHPSSRPWIGILLESVAPIVLLLVCWEFAVVAFAIPELFAPRPSSIVLAILNNWPVYAPHLAVTLSATCISFCLSLLGGVALGTLVAEAPFASRALMPIIVALQSMPRIALAPLIILWFGFGMTSKIVLGTFTAFFPVFINVIYGSKASDPDMIALMRSLNATRLQTFVKIKLPTSLPYIMSAANVAFVFALLSVIVAEFVGSNKGVGYLIISQSNHMDTVGVFSVAILMSIFGVSFHYFMQGLSNKLLFWMSDTEIGGASI